MNSYNQLVTIDKAIYDNPQILLTDLQLDLSIQNRKVCSPCMIHNGSNIHALNVYFNEYGRAAWFCATRSCEKVFINNMIGFTRGVLSNRYMGWRSKGDKLFPFKDCIEYLTSLYKIGNMELVEVDTEKKYLPTHGYVKRESLQSYVLGNLTLMG